MSFESFFTDVHLVHTTNAKEITGAAAVRYYMHGANVSEKGKIGGLTAHS